MPKSILIFLEIWKSSSRQNGQNISTGLVITSAYIQAGIARLLPPWKIFFR